MVIDLQRSTFPQRLHHGDGQAELGFPWWLLCSDSGRTARFPLRCLAWEQSLSSWELSSSFVGLGKMSFSSVGRKRLLSGLKSERQHGLVGGRSWGGMLEFTSHLYSPPPLRPGVCHILHLCLRLPVLSGDITHLGCEGSLM